MKNYRASNVHSFSKRVLISVCSRREERGVDHVPFRNVHGCSLSLSPTRRPLKATFLWTVQFMLRVTESGEVFAAGYLCILAQLNSIKPGFLPSLRSLKLGCINFVTKVCIAASKASRSARERETAPYREIFRIKLSRFHFRSH